MQLSPVGPFVGSTIKPKIGLTPVLRAGLGMTDALLSIFPYVSVCRSSRGAMGVHEFYVPGMPQYII